MGGRDALNQHAKTERHKKATGRNAYETSISKFFAPKRSSLEENQLLR